MGAGPRLDYIFPGRIWIPIEVSRKAILFGVVRSAEVAGVYQSHLREELPIGGEVKVQVEDDAATSLEA